MPRGPQLHASLFRQHLLSSAFKRRDRNLQHPHPTISMASTLSTTTQPPGSQPLCESLNTTLELCDLARQVALHLETPSSLERITREGEEVFRIKWMKQFEDLANEVIKTAVCETLSCISITCY